MTSAQATVAQVLGSDSSLFPGDPEQERTFSRPHFLLLLLRDQPIHCALTPQLKLGPGYV